MAEITILYVEDDEMSREVMSILIETSLDDAQLTLFKDSTNFVERVTNLSPSPQLILLDIHVAPLNGFQMLEQLRTMPKFAQAKIIALTASVMNEEVRRLRDAGFDGVIGKPIDQLVFPSVIQRILAGESVWQIR